MPETEVQQKICGKCHQEKPTSEFYNNKCAKDGLNGWCKPCIKQYGITRNRKRPVITDERKLKLIKFIPKPVREASIQKKKCKTKNEQAARTHATKFYRNCFFNAYEWLVSLGLSEYAVQTLFNCSPTGLRNHTIYNPKGEEVYQKAIAELQAMLASNLLVHALGFDYTEEKVIWFSEKTANGKGKWTAGRKEKFIKHHTGSPELLIFYMTNRFPDQWKVSRELLTGKVPGYDDDPGRRDRKKIEAIAGTILNSDTGGTETEHPVQG